jgi:hypothetical protein
MKENDLRYNIGELASASQSSRIDDELAEKKRIQKNALIKMGTMGILSMILLIFFTISWFTMNTQVESGGMQIAAGGPNYEILVLENGSNGQYYADYHSLVKDSSAVVWQMVDANNMGNYNDTSQNPGIKPGSYGMVSFYVKPLVDTVDLSFNFEILGYEYDEDAVNSTDKMKLLDSDESPALFLNGHILLFEKRTGTTEDNFVYSKPILSNEDMQRVISRNTYTKKADNSPTQVDIYWVWPTTLSKVIDARGCAKISVTEEPFTSKTAYSESASTSAYSEVVDNIRAYPDYYCKGVSRPANAGDMLSEPTIVTDYDKYGDYYDQADNDIGMGVNFILLKLSISQVSSSGE